MKPTQRTILAITVIGLLFLAGCASQKDVIILDERLMILERQNQELQQKIDSLNKLVSTELERVGKSSQSTETNLRTKYAGLNADMAALQQDVRGLSGRLDEISHQLQRKTGDYETGAKTAQARIDELSLRVAKLEQRSTEFERYLNLDASDSSTGAAENTSEGKSAGKAKADTAAELYAAAKKTYDSGQTEKARRQFEHFLKTFPDSKNADNAQFWIGESYYREKWYEKAILEYQTVIEKYPKGNKVPAAMLKQGMAFLQIGDKSNASLVWKELTKKFSGSNEAKIASIKLKDL